MNFMDILIGVLIEIAILVLPLVLLGLSYLRSQAARIDNELLQGITMRSVQTVEAVTEVAFNEFELLAKGARAPASEGGVTISAREWEEIVDILINKFKKGFGQNWLTRAGQILGIVEFENSVRDQIESSLNKKLDQKRESNAKIRAASPN